MLQLWTAVFYCWVHRQGWWLCWKKRLNFYQIWESNTREGENLQMLYIMNLVSLVVLENFELSAVITPSVISNILSNEALGGNIWIFPVILSCVKGQWKVCYNKLKQGNFQKNCCWWWNPRYLSRTCSCCDPVVIQNHFLSTIFGRLLKTRR